MKLKYKFEAVDMIDEIVAVPVGDGAEKVNGVVKLNKAALEIFNCLLQDTTTESIVAHLTSVYDDAPDVLMNYVNETVNILRQADLIEE